MTTKYNKPSKKHVCRAKCFIELMSQRTKEKCCIGTKSFLNFTKRVYPVGTSRTVWHQTSTTVSNYQWIIKQCRKHLTLLSPIIHCSLFPVLCSKQRTCVSACCCSSVQLFAPLLASLKQTLKALISRKHCLEKGSIRHFTNQQWILKPLVRYSA